METLTGRQIILTEAKGSNAKDAEKAKRVEDWVRGWGIVVGVFRKIHPAPLAGRFTSVLGQAGLLMTGYRLSIFCLPTFHPAFICLLSSPLLCSSEVYFWFCFLRVDIHLWLLFLSSLRPLR